MPERELSAQDRELLEYLDLLEHGERLETWDPEVKLPIPLDAEGPPEAPRESAAPADQAQGGS